MATPDLPASEVMDKAAVLLNDVAKKTFTYAVQIPYLNLALQELEEEFEQAEVPTTDTVTVTPILIPAGQDHMAFTPTPPVPALPNDLIEPQLLWERQAGIEPFIPMTKLDFLPRYMEGQEFQQLIWWVWQTQQIKFFASVQNNEIKMDYIRNLFAAVTSPTDALNIINGATYLEYKSAAIMARFISQDKPRSDELNVGAAMALDRTTGIGTKGRQGIITRRRPFRASYKRRQFM